MYIMRCRMHTIHLRHTFAQAWWWRHHITCLEAWERKNYMLSTRWRLFVITVYSVPILTRAWDILQCMCRMRNITSRLSGSNSIIVYRNPLRLLLIKHRSQTTQYHHVLTVHNLNYNVCVSAWIFCIIPL